MIIVDSSSRFEQEAGYPKQDARFLDLSIRAICTTEEGKDVPIEKDLITSKWLDRSARNNDRRIALQKRLFKRKKQWMLQSMATSSAAEMFASMNVIETN